MGQHGESVFENADELKPALKRAIEAIPSKNQLANAFSPGGAF